MPDPPQSPEGEEMHREVGGRGQDGDEDEELNTGQKPPVAANASSAPQVDTSKAASPPPPDDTTPLLHSASPRRAYHTVPVRSAADDLQRSLQHPHPTIFEEEEEENQLIASLPSSLGHNSLHMETTPVRKEGGMFSLTDTGDDDETFQAKLFAVRKEARHRRKLKRTISSALDITEDVSVALLGNPNLAEACHHSPTPSRSDTPPTPSDTPPTTQGVFVA